MGIHIERDFQILTDRYKWDYNYCKPANGWAQIDTKQDAPYYGTWANPFKYVIVNYAEGDVIVTKCDTEDDFIQAMQECIDWNVQAGYWIGIDGMCRDEIIAEFTRLGFGNMLH